jgi:Peptidase M15
MPLTGTKNFTVAEALKASGGSIPLQFQGNAQATLELLQSFRDLLGRPILITSLYRSPEHNAAVPGHADNSQHMTADAADFDVVGMTDEQAAWTLWQAELAGRLPPYRQLIVYAGDNHVHVGRGDGRQKLVKLAGTDSGYQTLTLDYLKAHLGTVASISAGAIVLAILAFFFPGRSTTESPMKGFLTAEPHTGRAIP